jgi:hypothetical protein
MGWYYCSWWRELTDLDQWGITVPHAVDQILAWKMSVGVLCRRKRQHLKGHCKYKSKNSSSSCTKHGETSECLHSGEWWALPARFMKYIFRSYCIVALWRGTAVAFKNEHPIHAFLQNYTHRSWEHFGVTYRLNAPLFQYINVLVLQVSTDYRIWCVIGIVELAMFLLCVRPKSNIISLRQVTSLTISSSVVGLLPLASGQDSTKIGLEPQKLNIYGEQHGTLFLTTKERNKF